MTQTTQVRLSVAVAALALLSALPASAQGRHAALDLWAQGKPAFGVYVPNENPQRFVRGQPPPKAIYTKEGAAKLGANPLYDFVFLNLEGSYDPAAAKTVVDGLRSVQATGSRKTVIVRIPSIESDGVEATRTRVKEVLAAGADGVTIPHIRSLDEAKTALGFFQEAKANVWSPSNPNGTVIAMLMVEDPDAVAAAGQIADLKGLSVLACGIGSLRQALKGDAAGAEAGTQKVLAETKRTRLPNMLTANPQDVAQRVNEGFLGLLGQGASVDDMIRAGRQAAGR
ncbi:MAG: aldolase/citrate lyase family protein [Vicinamibacterales bacterium]